MTNPRLPPEAIRSPLLPILAWAVVGALVWLCVGVLIWGLP